MRRLPPLNALRVFEECARALSFSAAAQTLCVTHSAVSHQIRQLEEWFGQKLFIRHAGGIALTLSGETLQRTASQVLSQLEQTCAQLCQRPPRQELVIAAPASFLANWLIPRLELFEQAHPNIQLRLQTNARPEALLSGTVDLLIQSSSQLLPDSILSLPLLVERTGPVCAPDWHPSLAAPKRWQPCRACIPPLTPQHGRSGPRPKASALPIWRRAEPWITSP